MCLGTFRVNDDYSERFSFVLYLYLLYTFFFLVVSIELISEQINKIERKKNISKKQKKKLLI